MRRSTLAAAFLAIGALVSSLARAQSRGQDEVNLKNGGSIRGTLVASEPGTSVKIIELGETQARVIPWSEVAGVEKGKYAPSPAQPGLLGPASGDWPPPPMGTPGVVRVHIESPLPATLIEQRPTLVGYDIVPTPHPVRSAPCDAVVDGTDGRLFELSSELYPGAALFGFGARTGDVTLHVRPGSRIRLGIGITATALGLPSLLAGVIVLPLSFAGSTTELDSKGNVIARTYDSGLRAAGFATLIGGAVLLGTGIALIVTGKTRVRIEQHESTAGRAAWIKPRYWLGEF